MFGLFVAYETRKIKVEAINDSKHIGKNKKKTPGISWLAYSSRNDREDAFFCSILVLAILFYPQLCQSNW